MHQSCPRKEKRKKREIVLDKRKTRIKQSREGGEGGTADALMQKGVSYEKKLERWLSERQGRGDSKNSNKAFLWKT